LICGETGSGKSTFLSSLLNKYCRGEKVVILESLLELPLSSNLWMKFIERKTDIEGRGGIKLSSIMKETLRIRPDRIIVGEIRGDECLVFLDSINSGHSGGISTIHAGNIEQLKAKLCLILMEFKHDVGYIEKLFQCLDELVLIFMGRGDHPEVRRIEKFNGGLLYEIKECEFLGS
jgi:Flp pilus assembly CpaF family ATPase